MDQGTEHLDTREAKKGHPIALKTRTAGSRTAYVIAAALVLAIAGGGAYYFRGIVGTPEVHYTTAAITEGAIERAVSSSGTVNPVLTVIVGSYISGVIVGQYCDYNTRVREGQLCARIDPRPYQSAVDEAKANLAVAKAQLTKDRANLAYQKGLYERNAALLKRGIVSQETADNSKSAYDQATAQVELDQATIEQRSAALKAAAINLDYTNIRSPVSGTVVSRNITIGQTVAASFQTPTLFLIATDLTKMQVDCNVSESDIGGLKEGTRAVFTVEAYPQHPFEGHVVQVRQAPQSIQNVVTYDVVIGVDNGELLLKPGMTATVRIVTAERRNVLRVPDQALRYTPGEAARAAPGRTAPAKGEAAGASRVWLLRDGKPAPIPVRIGLDDDTYSEVAEGELKTDDRVITGEQRENRAAPAPAGGPRVFGR